MNKRAGKQRSTRSSRQKSAKQAVAPLPAEDRRAEAVTVAWMLATVATGGAELLGLIVYLLLRFDPAGKVSPEPLRALPPLMLFTALIVGLISLAMVPIVYQFRHLPPPRSVTAVSISLALLPIVLLAISYLWA